VCHLCRVSFMLSVIYAECHLCLVSQKALYAFMCHYAKCRYAECRGATSMPPPRVENSIQLALVCPWRVKSIVVVVLTLAPWAVQQLTVTILLVDHLPEGQSQVQPELLFLAFLALLQKFCSFSFPCQTYHLKNFLGRLYQIKNANHSAFTPIKNSLF
jgi:hypothetical protein